MKTLKYFFKENSIYKLGITWKNIFGIFIIGTYCMTVGGYMIKCVYQDMIVVLHFFKFITGIKIKTSMIS